MSATFDATANGWATTAANLAAMAGKSKVTVSFWAKYPSFPATNNPTIEYNGPWISTPESFYYSGGTTGAQQWVGENGNVGLDYGTTAGPLSTATWYHTLFEFDFGLTGVAEVVGLWVNGASQALTKTTTGDNTGTFASSLLTLFSRLSGSNVSPGIIDDLAIFAGVNLGSGDRALLYNGHGNDPGLSVQPDYYWQLKSDGAATLGAIAMTLGSGVTFDGNWHTNPNPTSFTISPTSVPVWPSIQIVPGNSGGRVVGPYKSIALTGTGTSWAGTPFSVTNAGSGVASLIGQFVISGTSAVIWIDEGNIADTLHITDGASTTNLTLSAAAATHNQVIGAGDSLSMNFGDGLSTPWPNQLLPKLTKDWQVYGFGRSGATVDNFPWTNSQIADPNNVAAAYSGAATLSVLVVGGCLNDFNTGSPPSAASIYAKYKSHIATFRAFGANTRVIVWTVPPCDTGVGLTDNPNINANVAALNALLLAGFTSGDLGAHIIIDLASDPRWSEPNDGYDATVIQSADDTHWKTIVSTTLAERVAGAVELLAAGGGSIPGSGGGGSPVFNPIGCGFIRGAA